MSPPVSAELAPLLVAGLALVGVCLGVFAVAAPMAERRARRFRRIGSVDASRPTGRDGDAEHEARRLAAAIRRSRRQDSASGLRRRLAEAGLAASPRRVAFGVAALAASGAAAGIGLGLAIVPAALFGLAMAPAFGLALVRLLAARRRAAMEAEFPTVVDVVVRGVKSGMPLSDCLEIVAREAAEPLRSEFATLVEEQRHGVPAAVAVDRFARRVPLPEAGFFSIVVAIQAKTGGRLAEPLDNLAGVLRARTQLRAKIKSMSAEATASGAIIAALPPVVTFLVWLTSPDYIAILFEEPIGHVVLVCSAIWMIIGVLVMRKMIAFEY